MTKRVQFIAWLFVLFLFSQNSFSQCSANFSIIQGPSNTFTFQGATVPSNPNTIYSWNFGDGNIANGATVTHQYSGNANFTVTLNILMSSPNCSATVSQTVSTLCPLVAGFTYSVGSGGLVTFTSTSTGTTASTNYFWDFDDGNTSNAPSFTSNTFTANGTYQVSFELNDSTYNCTDSVAVAITFSTFPCSVNAGFSWMATNSQGQVFFNNTTTPSQPTPTCSWAFGDGGTSNQYSPAHSYSATGSYVATLTALQGTCSSTFTNMVSVNITPCTVSANFTYTLANNGQVNFTNTSAMPANYSSSWNFGNNTYGVGNNPTAYYFSNGIYNVNLHIYDSLVNSCIDTISIPVSVSNVTCALTGWPLTFSSYETFNGDVSFNTNLPGTNFTFNWNFGNGTLSAAPTPSTTYNSAGVYSVTLSVTDPSVPGCFANFTNTVQVFYIPCILNASFTSTLNNNVLNVQSTSTGTTTSSNLFPIWDWGDGNWAYGAATSNTVHTYLYDGTYTVALIIQDSTSNFSQSCHDSTAIVINVTGAPCPVNSNFFLQQDMSQLYSWFAYPNYQSNVMSATWNWGDGTSSNSLYPSHTYSAAGWYNICLTVSLSCGSPSTTCYTNFLNRHTEANSQVYIQVVNQTASVKANEITPANITIFPNPSDGEFVLSSGGYFVNNLRIYNNIGECIYSLNEEKLNEQQGKIKLDAVPGGCYLLQLQTANGMVNRKLIINR